MLIFINPFLCWKIPGCTSIIQPRDNTLRDHNILSLQCFLYVLEISSHLLTKITFLIVSFMLLGHIWVLLLVLITFFVNFGGFLNFWARFGSSNHFRFFLFSQIFYSTFPFV